MKPLTILAGGCLLGLFTFGPVAAQGPRKKEALVDQVKKSIDKGISFLRSQQRPSGSWEVDLGAAGMEGGWTGLALLSLLNAGVPADDPDVKRGLDYYRRLRPNFTYVRALQTMVLAEAGRVQDRELIVQNVKWLIDARVFRDGDFRGWSYTKNPSRQGDNSNTQYALLGLHAGKMGGAMINQEIWKSIRDYYIRTQVSGKAFQDQDGGFVYSLDGPGARQPTLTMTTAGLCGLLIAGMELNASREVLQDGVATNCGLYEESQPAARALSWIGGNFRLDLTQRTFYNLYGIERAGRLSGLRFIGGHDWYREGCQYLVREQHDDGSWASNGSWDKWPVVSTSFALLFLSKGRTPVLISKLVHSAEGRFPRPPDDTDWNNDRNDIRHLTEFASRELFNKMPLAWQIFDLKRAAGPNPSDDDLLEVTSDLLQSPIVYFNGHLSPRRRFQEVEKKILQKYVENGGFILVEACCGKAAFDQGFKKLVNAPAPDGLFPDNPLEYLPENHPIWTSKFRVSPGQPYKLMGIQMGCKTVLVYSPQDLSCYWEGNRQDGGRDLMAFRLGANIVAYATGMEPPRPRLTRVEVADVREDPAKIPRGYFKVAQLKYNGDYKPAPRAMRNLMDHLHKFADLNVVLKTDELRVHFNAIKDYKFIYLHGRGDFRYGKTELDNLRFNLEHGGLLFADACCGQAAFDKAFRRLALELFPKHKLERIPENDILFSKELNGEALTRNNIKARQERNGMPRLMAPWLEGIRVNDRWAVIYSKYDIGCALEKHQSSDCIGYVPESALKLASAAVLYTLRPFPDR